MKNTLRMMPIILACLLLPLGNTTAQEIRVNDATELADVLESVHKHFPLIKAAQAEIRGQDALVRAAQGAFDPVIEGSYKNRLSGFYDGTSMSSFYRKRFPAFGAEVFAGYASANGNFPVYENNLAVLQRRSLVVDARRLLDASAYKLSLFLRNEDGSPLVPLYRDGLVIPEESLGNVEDIDAIVDRVTELDPQIAMARLDQQQEELANFYGVSMNVQALGLDTELPGMDDLVNAF